MLAKPFHTISLNQGWVILKVCVILADYLLAASVQLQRCAFLLPFLRKKEKMYKNYVLKHSQKIPEMEERKKDEEFHCHLLVLSLNDCRGLVTPLQKGCSDL